MIGVGINVYIKQAGGSAAVSGLTIFTISVTVQGATITVQGV